MSAATAWDLAPTAPDRLPARPARSHLRLVPAGEGFRAGAPSVRVTRRGRLAVTLAVAVAVAAFAFVLFSGLPGATVIDHATTVRADQTLSEVASQQLPQLPVRQAVAQIQLANDLNTTQVHAGQSLLIPRLP